MELRLTLNVSIITVHINLVLGVSSIDTEAGHITLLLFAFAAVTEDIFRINTLSKEAEKPESVG